MSDRLAKPSCLIVASAATAGVSAQSFLHCFTLASSAFNLQVATPGGKPIDFVDVNEGNTRWIQDFRMKSYASPAKLESIDGARYHALLIPNCPGAVTDLANSGYLAKILQHFSAESKPICAVGQGVAALCCATKEDKSWVFQGYSLTGPSVYELVRQPNFASLSIIVEDFVKDSGATFSASSPDAVHVVLDRHLVTGQNDNSTLPAVQNLLILCNVRDGDSTTALFQCLMFLSMEKFSLISNLNFAWHNLRLLVLIALQFMSSVMSFSQGLEVSVQTLGKDQMDIESTKLLNVVQADMEVPARSIRVPLQRLEQDESKGMRSFLGC
ncbi:Parkinson disease 7 domain-containing protein 1 [Turdus rufiventris]|nr:Parkinson disease 7 domain-containing protein 1 [Turdus rufiventris]